MNLDEKKTDTFLIRNYQLELLEKCKSGNIIVFLPTGSGKTYIATKLIAEMAEQLQNGKKSFFLVHRKVLVHQQARQLKRHLAFRIGEYHGDMNVDNWEPSKWTQELDSHDILVMTAQVFLDRLLCGFFSLKAANLLILDECHHSSKGDPYRRIMDMYAKQWTTDPESAPKILGLTAALVKQKTTSWDRVKNCLDELRANLHASIETTTDSDAVVPFSACPEPEIVFFCKEPQDTCGTCLNFGTELLQKRLEFQSLAKGEKVLQSVAIVVRTLGIWSAGQVSNEFIRHLTTLGAQMGDDELKRLAHELVTVSSHIREHTGSADSVDHLLRYCPDTRAREVLRLLSTADKDNLSAIVFVEQRIVAYALRDLLMKAAEVDPESFGHIKPAAVIGYTRSYSIGGKMPEFDDMSLAEFQNKALEDFQNGDINVLVSTNVLEEGVDIGVCNCVIRFDLPKDYCSYIQSRGRARHRSSRFFVLLSNAKEERLIDDFKSTSDIILSIIENGRTSPADLVDSGDYDYMMEPYVVASSNGCEATVKLSNAIQKIFYYCSTLPTDTVPLQPEFYVQEKSPMGPFQAYLQLPKNSPVQDIVQGPLMERISLAKKAAGLQMCKLLHEKGQLDDYLLPIKKVDFLLDHALGEHSEPNAGRKRRRQIYNKHCPLSENNTVVQEHLPCYITKVLIKDSTNGGFDNIGFLSPQQLPSVPGISLFPPETIASVSFARCSSSVVLCKEQIKVLKDFHCHLFKCILSSSHSKNRTEYSCEVGSLLFVPLIEQLDTPADAMIDWQLAYSVANLFSKENCQSQVDMCGKLCQMNGSTLNKSVFVPWYRNHDWPSLYSVKLDQCATAQSQFPEDRTHTTFSTYQDYYKNKYKIELNDPDQPLLVSKPFSPPGLNRLLQNAPTQGKAASEAQEVKTEHIWKQYLLPELVLRHPVSVHYWRYVWLLPSILYRLNALLCSRDICCLVVPNMSPEETWMPLNSEQFAPQHQNMDVSDSFLDADASDVLLSDESFLDGGSSNWAAVVGVLLDLPSGSTIRSSSELNRAGSQKTYTSTDGSIMPFDAGSDMSYLSMPALVLEALTTKSANDAFNLERLETLGDSFLKLIVTEFLYNSCPLWHEGHLTAARTTLVCNKTLYTLGRKANFGSCLQCSQFRPGFNWIPPGFLSITDTAYRTSDLSYDPITQHEVSDKAIADSVEALIGAFLISAGQHTARKFIEHIGVLQLLRYDPDEACPSDDTILSCDDELAKLWVQKGFSQLETVVGYEFKNKNLLLTAFTHPSFTGWSPGSYQRLEFFGDAVIDYLIMRYSFGTCRNSSPGFLTDVRSSLVTNQLFAKVAVKYGLQKFLLESSFQLHRSIEKFVKAEEQLDPMEQSNEDPPKVLGDLVESLAAAIFLDSGESLETVWKVIYPMMCCFIESYKKSPPKNPMRELYELVAKKGWKQEFLKLDSEDERQIKFALRISGVLETTGTGKNSRNAKSDAAKKALASLASRVGDDSDSE